MGRDKGRSLGTSDKHAPMSRIADKHPLARNGIFCDTGKDRFSVDVRDHLRAADANGEQTQLHIFPILW